MRLEERIAGRTVKPVLDLEDVLCTDLARASARSSQPATRAHSDAAFTKIRETVVSSGENGPGEVCVDRARAIKMSRRSLMSTGKLDTEQRGEKARLIQKTHVVVRVYRRSVPVEVAIQVDN